MKHENSGNSMSKSWKQNIEMSPLGWQLSKKYMYTEKKEDDTQQKE